MLARSTFAYCLACLLLIAPLTSAQQSTPSASEAALKRPTDFRSRIEIRDEYQDLEGGGYRNIVVPRFEYAMSPSIALRLETPYVNYAPGDGGSVSGQGDVLARGAWRIVQRSGFAMIFATDVIFDTADNAKLGYGKTVVAPHLYAAIDIPKHDSVFFPNIQHYQSIAGSDSRADVNFTTLKPNLLTRWPNQVYTFLEPQFTVDWEHNDKVGLTVELEVGKILSKNVAAWIRPGVGVINKNVMPQVYNWNLELGARHVF